ncbi:MAG: DUF3108 domain-containing protein [Gammaproteobacteria bacterium]|nr:DUF3108 domain-containing protein [Gammaproteobacteria bacterium]
MIKKTLLLPLTALLFCATAVSATEEIAPSAFVPFQANYKVFRKGSELGEAYRKLHVKNDQYTLETDSKISWLFLSDNRHEISTFDVKDNKISALTYQYKRTGTGRDRKSFTEFGVKGISSTYKSKDYQFDYQDNVLDPQLYQLAMQQQLIEGKTEFSFPLIRRGKQIDYRFRVVAEEVISLPYGKLATLKLERIRETSKRQTYMWVAPSLNYAMVKLTQIKEGKEQADLQLSWFKFEKED